ncbi:hypothetical protein BD309DRAFT_973214, partial [Dichomitus squalens]
MHHELEPELVSCRTRIARPGDDVETRRRRSGSVQVEVSGNERGELYSNSCAHQADLGRMSWKGKCRLCGGSLHILIVQVHTTGHL